MGETCSYLDPCIIVTIIKRLILVLILFILFGYIGKAFIISEENDISFGDAFKSINFWNWDSQFWFAGIAILSMLFSLMILLLFLKCCCCCFVKKCCNKNDNDQFSRLIELMDRNQNQV